MAVVKDARAERLTCLFEEMGEAIQAIGKAMRHGLDSSWMGGPDNQAFIEREVGQVRACTQLLIEAGDLTEQSIHAGEVEKYTTIQPYLHAKANRKLAKHLAHRMTALNTLAKRKR